MPAVSASAIKVLIVITRLTLGWRGTDTADHAVEIGIGGAHGLSSLTGLSHQGVISAVRELAGLELLLFRKGPRNSRTPNHYALNLDLTTGQLVKNLDQSKNLSSPTSQIFRPKLVKIFDSLRNKGNTIRTESDKQTPDPSDFPIPKGRKLGRRGGIPPELHPTISRVIARINELGGTHYRDDSPGTLKTLIALLRAGATEAQCLAVVEHQWRKWGDNEEMREHFNPVTLFREQNFARYLANAERANCSGTGNGQAKAPEVKDLGDGNVDVGGQIMAREMYERRYGQAAN
jgi:uncharacterized phage protein (TIGR02220 family)